MMLHLIKCHWLLCHLIISSYTKHAILSIRSAITIQDIVGPVKDAGSTILESIGKNDTLDIITKSTKSLINGIPGLDILGRDKLADIALVNKIAITDTVVIIKYASVELVNDITTLTDTISTRAHKIVNVLTDGVSRDVLSSGTGKFVGLASFAKVKDTITIIKLSTRNLYDRTRIFRDKLLGPSIGVHFDVTTARRKIFRF